jgi:hypothetical protein
MNMSKPNRLSPTKTGKSGSPQPARDPQAPLTGVEKLAILNRYVFPVVAVFGPVLLAKLLKWDLLIPLGIGCYVFGAYQLLGYKSRWDHIYCSIQLFKRQRMTPNEINWDRISKFDATALPIAFVILGTFALLFGTNGL